ncbi:ubiquinone biosynthesis accessory factor UbiJ [Kaarinaea lacus]
MTKLPNTLTALIEIAFNRYLNLDPEAKRRMPALAGKVVQINIREIDVALFMKVTGNRIEVLSSYDGEIHSQIRASILSLVKMGVAKDTSALGEDIEMSGELDVGRQFRDLLAKVDIDWEEVLSRYTGDIVAHKIGNSIRWVKNWGTKTTDSLGKDVVEYLQEESRQLPSAYEVNQFITDVDDVRMGVDRAEARIKELRKHLPLERFDNNEAQD